MSASRFSEFEQRNIIRLGQEYLERLYGMNPVPAELNCYSGQELYYGFFEPEVQQAMEEINRLNLWYRDRDDANLRMVGEPWRENAVGVFKISPKILPLDKEHLAGDYAVTFAFDFHNADSSHPSFFAPRSGQPYIGEGHPYYSILLPWVENHMRLNRIIKNGQELFSRIANSCRTPGQWNTVFPEYAVLLTKDQQQVIAGRKRNSPWPYDLAEDVRVQVKGLKHMFAKCSFLPERTQTEPFRIYMFRKLPEGCNQLF